MLLQDNPIYSLLTAENKPGTLSYRHPEYLRRRWWREFCRISYVGGREYHSPTSIGVDFQEPLFTTDNGISTFKEIRNVVYPSMLYRHSREKEWEYHNRTKRAYYFNFVQSIVDMLVSHATKRAATRGGDEMFSKWITGVDEARTTTIDQYMREGLRWSRVMGIYWTCMDAAPSDSPGAANPYLYWVSPLDILDWETDSEGNIEWLKQFVGVTKSRAWNEPLIQRFQFRIWSKTDVKTFETDDKGVGEVVVPGLTRAHGLGRVPFIPLYAKVDKSLPVFGGTSPIEDLAKGANTVFNINSLLDEIRNKQTFSWLAVPTKHIDTLQMGVNTAFGYDATQTGGARPEYLAPDPEQARVLMESGGQVLEQLRQSVGVGRGRQEGSMQKSSGEALELESEDKRTILGDIAASGEDFERRLYDLYSRFRSSAPAREKVSIQYPREFDVRALQQELDETLAFKKLPVSKEIVRELVEQLVRRKFSGIEPDRIKELLATLDGVDFAPQPIVAHTPPPPASGDKAAPPVPPKGAVPAPEPGKPA